MRTRRRRRTRTGLSSGARKQLRRQRRHRGTAGRGGAGRPLQVLSWPVAPASNLLVDSEWFALQTPTHCRQQFRCAGLLIWPRSKRLLNAVQADLDQQTLRLSSMLVRV